MAFSALDYSDDYSLDIVAKTGKKLLQFPEINHVQGKIRIRGGTRLPQGNQVITIQASLSQLVGESLRYKGLVKDKGQFVVKGQKSSPLKSSRTLLIGSKIKSITESIVIKGKKDYIILLDKFKELGYDN
jgi:hypothetical protein